MNRVLQIIIITTVLILTGIFFVFNKPAQDDEIIFWTLQMSDFDKYINRVITDFEKENPDIKIKWVDVPFSEGEKRTLAAVLSDNPPDLVNLNPDFSSTLAHKKALQEIPEESSTQFNKEILNSLKTQENKLYSIPWYATSSITIYNKNLITEVPKTYEDIVRLAPTVRKTSSAYITIPNITENDTMLKILNKYGCSSYETIDSGSCPEVFEIFKQLYVEKLIPKETVTITLQEALEKYMSGNIALLGAGANFLNMIKENAPSVYKNTDVAPQITGKIGQNDFSLMNFVIPLKSKHKQQALKFALFLTNEQNQLELAKLTNVLAVNEKALQDDFYTKYDSDDIIAKARVISASQLNKLSPVFKTKKGQKEINNLVNEAVQNILLERADTKSILTKLVKNLKIIDEK